ncbi:MAG: hypothetical protein EGP81_05310 [Bacteroides clarus]|jgi:hypothetical protein|uniref:hypothetical protein n=1 Tax=Bacteroides clarus TaxID=626929 RepID=UPI00241E7116|nr:hypothetical protein [Bacteroides clarus]MBD9144963.1 hypothetical protein [Bacteroides clarus]
MRQTVEEAAREYWNSWLKSNPNIDKTRIVSLGFAFKAGADWQAKQSPWHDTTEKPVQGKLCLVEYKDPNGEIRVRLDKHCGFEWKEMCHYDRILRWAYVDDLKPPTFDQILEANKDVLQRMKEKGTL